MLLPQIHHGSSDFIVSSSTRSHPSAAGTVNFQTLIVDVHHVHEHGESLAELLISASICSLPPGCMLCHRAEDDPVRCTNRVEHRGIVAHAFCLLFANDLYKKGVKVSKWTGFRTTDIQWTIEQAAQKHCFICGESGASITCQEMGCDRSFHLPCSVEGECITQFFHPYRSFCWEHRPQQAVEADPEDTTTCLICFDLVEDRQSYRTLVCPVCKHAWFHRDCIQGQAMSDGFMRFQCPLCRDKDLFRQEMHTMGIRIPRRLSFFNPQLPTSQRTWKQGSGGRGEMPCVCLKLGQHGIINIPFSIRLPSLDLQAFSELFARHRHCNASECLCPGGREQVEEEGPWQLLLCRSCAAEGTHRFCSNLRNSTTSWECNSCVGPSTGKWQSKQASLGWAACAHGGLGSLCPRMSGGLLWPVVPKPWGPCS
ncbi:PHD finger protein 7-like [Apus apus]|uniref:PHD finger protein 7-like n=1 Tax=Apus apus TaxID=8895 RepID=UPI0021F870CA|nr:PHD finger protein 7-like [Apus apus]